MKYGLVALLLLFALPGCSCMREGDKKDKKPKKEKRMKKPAPPAPMMPARPMGIGAPEPMMPVQMPEQMMPAQMPVEQGFVPEMMEMDEVQEEGMQF